MHGFSYCRCIMASVIPYHWRKLTLNLRSLSGVFRLFQVVLSSAGVPRLLQPYLSHLLLTNITHYSQASISIGSAMTLFGDYNRLIPPPQDNQPWLMVFSRLYRIPGCRLGMIYHWSNIVYILSQWRLYMAFYSLSHSSIFALSFSVKPSVL